jgi:hypothetical protein
VQRRGVGGPVEGPAQRLAVDRHHASRGLGEASHEAQEAGVEPRRVEQSEHPAERVVRGDAGRQAQERLLRAAEQGHVGAVLPAAQDRAEGDREDPQQQVALGVAGTRVFQLTEDLGEPFHGTAPPARDATGRARRPLARKPSSQMR